MHDTEPVRHGSLLRAGALVLASTVALLTGLLFTTQSGSYAAYDPGTGFKLPSSMQGDFTNGGSRLEAGDGTEAWLGTKQQALVTLKMKQGVTANSDQAPVGSGLQPSYIAPGYTVECFAFANTCADGAAPAYAIVSAGVASSYGYAWYRSGVLVISGSGSLSGGKVRRALPTSCTTTVCDGFTLTIGTTSAYPQVCGSTVVYGTVPGCPAPAPPSSADPVRTGTPYARCANLSGDEINVYATPISYRESEATGIVGSPAPSFTLPTCPASHPVRMGWGFQGPSGPLATVTAPPIPAGLDACAGYACDVQSQPTTAAQECHQLNPDGTVSTTPGGPCPPGEDGYCMWGPYSLAAAECAGAPQADPVEVEQDPGCTPDGLANLNPFAWMGGIPCLFKYLFIPDGDAWGDAGAAIGAAWDGTAPAVVLDEGNKVFAPVVALQDVTAGECEGPPFTFPSLAGVTEPFTLHPLSTCNELATYLLGIYLPVATAMTYLGGFFSGTRLLLKSAGAESPVKDA